MDFNEFSKKTVSRIDKELKYLLSEWKSEVGKIDTGLIPLVDEFTKACEGGKKLRGCLVVLGYQLTEHLRGVRVHLGGEIIKIGAAYEIFHTAILAHDDIMDQSLLRRGKPSLHQALGGGHQGTSLSITLADAGFFLAVKIISESKFPDQEKNTALKWFSQTMLDTAMGQILDIQKGDSLAVAKYKTAKYTVSGPLVLGGILGKLHLGGVRAHLRGDQLLKDLAKFGENLGIAFQIQDDILDREVEWVGGTDSAKKEAEKYKNRAMKVLPRITKDKIMSKLLEQMAEYLIERSE